MLPFLEATAQTDSLYLEGTTFTANRPDAVAVPSSAGGVTMDVARMKTLPSILGSADPLAYAHYLPSMSAQSELDAGIHIQGNDSQHNLVSSGGVPIYGASHLLGLFSVFNPSHYGRMDYRISAPDVNRLGGRIDMALPKELKGPATGTFRLGMMAAEGSVTVPVGEKLGVKASARRTFLNLLYGRFLTMDGMEVDYGFTDLNLTAQWMPGADDRITLDGYWGKDLMDGGAGGYSFGAESAWSNGLAALHWTHAFDGAKLEQKAYYTTYRLTLDAGWSGYEAALPSSIGTYGYRADFTAGAFKAGLESACHRAWPQSPEIEGTSLDYSGMQEPLQEGWENTLYGRYRLDFGPFSADAGLKGSLYRSPEGKWLGGVDPDLSLGWNFYRGGRLTLRAGTQRQYLFRTGMTDIGFPSEFWILAGRYSDPQESIGTGLSYQVELGEFSFGADAYYRLLENQIEYHGSLMDFATGQYSLEDALLKGSGRAYGVNLSLNKVSGRLTGWIAYAWGRSLRSFDGLPECPASHERIHELDAVASYELGRWTFGATVVAASGTPYTAPEHLYLLANRLMCWWGPHNGSRLKPYFRADLSVNYYFHRGPGLENGINFSIYNATGADNELYWHLHIDREAQTFRYNGVTSGIQFMPSLSYFHKF